MSDCQITVDGLLIAVQSSFYGLNAVRFLSIISLILVFASTITVIVHNVKAFNAFEANLGNDSDLEDCDYIESVLFIWCRSDGR